jgi:hypothetical protein
VIIFSTSGRTALALATVVSTRSSMNDGRSQVAQQSATMAGIASELVSCIAMAHDETLFRISGQWSVVSDQEEPIRVFSTVH